MLGEIKKVQCDLMPCLNDEKFMQLLTTLSGVITKLEQQYLMLLDIIRSENDPASLRKIRDKYRTLDKCAFRVKDKEEMSTNVLSICLNFLLTNLLTELYVVHQRLFDKKKGILKHSKLAEMKILVKK